MAIMPPTPFPKHSQDQLIALISVLATGMTLILVIQLALTLFSP